MPGQFGLHRRNVNDTSFLNGATGPCVIQLFLLLLLLLVIFVPLDPATEQSVKNFVDFHLLPLGWHEVAFAGGVGMEWHGVVVVELVWVIGGGDGFGGHFTASDSVDDFELLISEVDIFHVELITNGPPPIFIFWLLNKLLNFIASFLLNNFFQFIVISKMFELVIPAIGDFTDFNFDLFVLLVVGLIVAELDVLLLLVGDVGGTISLEGFV
jgi:hypothetical protein